jgi:hypothetical protein
MKEGMNLVLQISGNEIIERDRIGNDIPHKSYY